MTERVIIAEFVIDTQGNGEHRDIRKVRCQREVDDLECQYAPDVSYQRIAASLHEAVGKAQEAGQLSPYACLATQPGDELDGSQDDVSL